MNRLKRLSLGLAGLCLLPTAQASIVNLTLDAVVDWSNYGGGNPAYTFIGSFDSSQLPTTPGYHFLTGSVQLLIDGVVASDWNCTTSGCAGHPNYYNETITQEEVAPGSYVTLRSVQDYRSGAGIALYRNTDGSYDLMRSELSVSWLERECNSGASGGSTCTLESHYIGVASGELTDSRVSQAPYVSEAWNRYGHLVGASLSPVPEPGGLVAMLAGAGGLGWLLRRQRGRELVTTIHPAG
ncbi:PEP-CTERM sorting domain-containing protein [Derxia gummosa]|uniref:PEP-CTERM sorting domain-containing protein n=1 Tax=Derxia gummosa DSM 723 TaxID=1121388 RepID=A0A8B6X3Y9_9BURK|nr:PEP-CTERM sorting domain-containing protein [Derxia gummosa]